MKIFFQRLLLLVAAMGMIGSSAFGMGLPYGPKVLYKNAARGAASSKNLHELLDLASKKFYGLEKKIAHRYFNYAAKIGQVGLTRELTQDKSFDSRDYSEKLLATLLMLNSDDYSEKLGDRLTYQEVENIVEAAGASSLKIWLLVLKDESTSKWGNLILKRINEMMKSKEILAPVYQECVDVLCHIIDYRLSEFNQEFQSQISQCAMNVLSHIANQNEPLNLVNFPLLMRILIDKFNMRSAVYNLLETKKIFDRVDWGNKNIKISAFVLIQDLLESKDLSLNDDFYSMAINKATKSQGENDERTSAMRREFLLKVLTEKVMAMGAHGYRFIESLVEACVKSQNPGAINNACKLLTEVIGKCELNDQIFINTAKDGVVIDVYNTNRRDNLRGHALALWKALFERGLGFGDANNLIKNTDIEKRGSSWLLTNQDGFVGLVRVLLEFRSKDKTLTNEQAFVVVDKFYPRDDREYCDVFRIFECIVGSLNQEQKTYVQNEVKKYLLEQSPSYYNSEVFKAVGGLLAVLFTINRNDELDELCLSFVVKCALSEDLPVRNAGIDFLKSENIRTAFFDKLKSIVDDRVNEIQEKFDLITSQNVTEILNQKIGIIKGYISVLYIYTLLLQADALQPKENRKLTTDDNQKIFSLVSLLLENHNFNSWNVMHESCGILRLLEAFILWFDKDILKTKLLLTAAIEGAKSSSEVVRSYAIGVLVAYAHKVKNGKDAISRIHQDLVNSQVDTETCKTLLEAITANTLEAGFTLTETFIGVTQARAKNKTMVNKETEKVDKERNERESMLYQTLMAPSKIKKPVKQVNRFVAGILNLDEMVKNRKNDIPAVNDEQLKNATRQELEAALLQRNIVIENAKNYSKIQQMYLDLKRMNNEINLIKNKLNEIK